MNKQRKVVITTTYNEMGIIIDTKAEEVAQPNLQQTCNQLATDTISRAAAIDAICEDGTQLERQGQYSMTMAERKQRDADILDALPSAQPKQRWIPCSERVPEEDEQVLVYLYDSPYIAWIDSNGEWNTEDFTLDKEEDREDEPIAWMPLPEPWKGEE